VQPKAIVTGFVAAHHPDAPASLFLRFPARLADQPQGCFGITASHRVSAQLAAAGQHNTQFPFALPSSNATNIVSCLAQAAGVSM
jgi:hypothetical protein